MGWLATTCWGATTHGKNRKQWEAQRSQSRASRSAATPEPTAAAPIASAEKQKRSQSSMAVSTASPIRQETALPSISVPGSRGADGTASTPILEKGQQLEEMMNDQSVEVSSSVPLSSPQKKKSPSKHSPSKASASSSANNSPTRQLPPPSMLVWANERNYSTCLLPEEEAKKRSETFFVADNGPFARSDTRGEMQRVQCFELCAEKRLVDFKAEEAERQAKAQRQLDIRFGRIQQHANQHTNQMNENLKRHNQAQLEKREALVKVISRKNRRNLAAIERCDTEEEANALRAASFLTIIRAVQRFSQFFLRVQQHKMMVVLKRLFAPIVRLRVARKKRLARAYVSAIRKLQKNPRPSSYDLLRLVPDLQTWPASQAQLFHARIRPFYVPKGVALCYEGEPVTFVFVLMSGKLTATQSVSRFKSSTGGGGHEDGAVGQRLGKGRGRGVGAQNSRVIHLGEKTQPFVLGEDLMSISNELNVKAFADEDYAIFGEGDDPLNMSATSQTTAGKSSSLPTRRKSSNSLRSSPRRTASRRALKSDTTNGMLSARGSAAAAASVDGSDKGGSSKMPTPRSLPLTRSAFRQERAREDKAAQEAANAKIAHLQHSVYNSATGALPSSFAPRAANNGESPLVDGSDDALLENVNPRSVRRVVNGVVDTLPFPLVLAHFKGGPHRKLVAPMPKRAVEVPCFHGRHTTTLRGSASTGGCYGWLITADQLSELIRDSVDITAAGLGEATGEAEETGLKKTRSQHEVLLSASRSHRESSEDKSRQEEGRAQSTLQVEGVTVAASNETSPALHMAQPDDHSSPPKIGVEVVGGSGQPTRTPTPSKPRPKGLAGLLGATRAVATRGTAMDRVSHHQLRENRLFELLEPHEAQALIPTSTVHTFIRGQCIYKYNDAESDVYVVAKGVVEVKQRVANPHHPAMAFWLQQRGLGPDRKPFYVHATASHGGGGGGGGGMRGARTLAGSPARAVGTLNNAGADALHEKERAIFETRFINVGYCFGDEDAIFSQWRSETAVAATDCVLLRFKAFDIISALTAKTVRYQSLKTAYNDDYARRFAIPPTPAVLNAVLVKGDGFPQLVTAAIGKDPQYRANPNAPPQQSSTIAATPTPKYPRSTSPGLTSPVSAEATTQNATHNSAFGPLVAATISAPLNSIPNANLFTNYVWPFVSLVGGGRRVDEPSSQELLAELLAGKGALANNNGQHPQNSGAGTKRNGAAYSAGAASGGSGSAFTLGGVDLRRTNLLFQHFVTISLARASLAHLCAVINPDSLLSLVYEHSPVVLDSMGVLGVAETTAAVSYAAAVKANGGSSSALTRVERSSNKGDKKGRGTEGRAAQSLASPAALSKSPSKTLLRSGTVSAASAAASACVIVQHPSLFSSFFHSAMRALVLSPGALLPSHTSIIYLQRGIVEISTESSVALGPDGRLMNGGGASKSTFGSSSRTETVFVAAPAFIVSGTGFKHAKEQLLTCLVNGTIELVPDNYKGFAGASSSIHGGEGAGKATANGGTTIPGSIVSSRDNGPPAETMVTRLSLIEDGLKTGHLQDPDGSIAAMLLAANASAGGKPTAAQQHRKTVMDTISGKGSVATAGKRAADDGSLPLTNARSSNAKEGTAPFSLNAKDNGNKDGAATSSGGSSGSNVTARLPHSPAIVFKYAQSTASLLDSQMVQQDLSGGGSVSGEDRNETSYNSNGSGSGVYQNGNGSPAHVVTARQIELYKQHAVYSEGAGELAQFAEEIGKQSGAQKVVAKSRVVCWNVFYIDAIRRFAKFSPLSIVKANAAAASFFAAATAALSNGATVASYHHLPQDTIDFIPEASLGAEPELQTLLNKSGIFVLR